MFTSLLLCLLGPIVLVCRSSYCGGGCDECGDECAGGGESEADGESSVGDESEADGESGVGDRMREHDDGDLGGAGGVITTCFISTCGIGGVDCTGDCILAQGFGGGVGVFTGVGGGVMIVCALLGKADSCNIGDILPSVLT